MKSNKEYRFKDNPKEQEFHDKFIDMFKHDRSANNTLSAIVFGWENDRQNYPKEYLSGKEEDICVNIIQWLGSPIGQEFLSSCGFSRNDAKNNDVQADVIKSDLACDVCGRHPHTIITTNFGRYCQEHAKYV